MTAALTLVADNVASAPPDPSPWLRRAAFDTTSYDLETIYYEGRVRMASMGWALPPGMDVLQTVVNWCALSVDSVARRLTVAGFRLADEDAPNAELTQMWEDARLPAESRLAHLEALVHRRAYLTMGPHPRHVVPIVRAESRRYLWADVDPATDEVRAAVRVLVPGPDAAPTAVPDVVLYLPDSTHYYARDAGTLTGWRETGRVEHGLGVVPVVPMTYGATVNARGGASRMRDVANLTDACCRTLTNLGGAQELLAVPQRYVLGAKEDDFKDPVTKQPVPKWQAYLGRFLALGNADAKVGQFSAADLRNFVEVVNLYAKLCASTTGLPPDYLGYSDANPTSADAINASRERLISDAEDIQVPFGDAYERAAGIMCRIMGDDSPIQLPDDPSEQIRIRALWDDPSTPTLAARADAVVKLYSAGLIPREAAWDVLGYTPEQQARYTRLLEADPLERLITGARGGEDGDGGGAADQVPSGTEPVVGDAGQGNGPGAARAAAG